MDYQSFINYLAGFLWRPNDKDLIAVLPSLIKMADAELTRKLKIQDRETSARLLVATEDAPLPDDYHSLRDVSSQALPAGRGELLYTTPAKLRQARAATNSQQFLPSYSLQHHTLLLCGPFTATEPTAVDITYTQALPDYAATDSSWLADEYLDLYTYTILKHTAPYLKADERIQTWAGLASDALESCLEDDAFTRTRAVSHRVGLPYAASSGTNKFS